jgi:uncharacterized protein YukE
METQITMTTDEIKAKIGEFKAKRAELEGTLSSLSKHITVALVTGESTTKLDAERHSTAEEIRHLGELVTGLEQSLVAIGKSEVIARHKSWLVKRQEVNTKLDAATERRQLLERELRQATKEEEELKQLWYNYGSMLGSSETELKKKHGLTEIEIRQIAAEVKA